MSTSMPNPAAAPDGTTSPSPERVSFDVRRPYTQIEPDPFGPATCPAWCRQSVHTVSHVDDRTHYGTEREVPLSLVAGEFHEGRTYLPFLNVYLEQNVRWSQAQVHLGLSEDVGWDLTLDEAHQLVQTLMTLVTAARLEEQVQ